MYYIWAAIFSSIAIFSDSVNTLVITEFGSDTLVSYYHKVKGNTTENWISQDELSQFCNKLRGSPTFKRSDPNTTWTNSEEEYSLNENFLDMEIRQLAFRQIRIHVGNVTQNEILPAFECLDAAGTLKLFVTPAFIKNSAFLSVIEPGFKHIPSTETGKKAIIHPKLRALIDEPGFFTNRSALRRDDLSALFSSSIGQGETNETLCELSNVIQLRLCAIAWTVLQSRQQDRRPGNDAPPGSRVYYTPIHTFSSELDLFNNLCRLTRIKPLDLTHMALRCAINTNTRISRRFYLNSNTEDTSKLFIMWATQLGRQIFMNFDEIEVPLLRHLEIYKDAFAAK